MRKWAKRGLLFTGAGGIGYVVANMKAKALRDEVTVALTDWDKLHIQHVFAGDYHKGEARECNFTACLSSREGEQLTAIKKKSNASAASDNVLVLDWSDVYAKTNLEKDENSHFAIIKVPTRLLDASGIHTHKSASSSRRPKNEEVADEGKSETRPIDKNLNENLLHVPAAAIISCRGRAEWTGERNKHGVPIFVLCDDDHDPHSNGKDTKCEFFSSTTEYSLQNASGSIREAAKVFVIYAASGATIFVGGIMLVVSIFRP